VISPEERAAVAAAAAEVDRLGAVAAVAELRDRLDAAARAPPRSAAPDPAHPDQQPQPKAAT
jgi:hypothetical protein